MEIMGVDVLYGGAVVVGWLGLSYLFWVFVARPMFKRWIKSTILGMLTHPDKDVKLAIDTMFSFAWAWFLTPAETGRVIKTKDEEGNETETKEALSPYQQIIAESARLIMGKINAGLGGTTTKMKNVLMQSASESGTGVSTAAATAATRGNFGPILAEIILPKVVDRLKKRDDTSSNQGGQW
jgi:hypothetical protein